MKAGSAYILLMKKGIVAALTFIWSQVPGVITLTIGIGMAFMNGWIDWGSKVADARLAEYQAISQQVEAFDTLLDKFTRKVVLDDQVDTTQVDQLSENLGVQFTRIGTFAANLEPAPRAVADEYRTAITDLKYGIITMKSKDDLKFVGASLARMYDLQADLVPVLKQAAGLDPSAS